MYLLNVLGVTLVSKILQVSHVQFYNTSSRYLQYRNFIHQERARAVLMMPLFYPSYFPCHMFSLLVTTWILQLFLQVLSVLT